MCASDTGILDAIDAWKDFQFNLFLINILQTWASTLSSLYSLYIHIPFDMHAHIQSNTSIPFNWSRWKRKSKAGASSLIYSFITLINELFITANQLSQMPRVLCVCAHLDVGGYNQVGARASSKWYCVKISCIYILCNVFISSNAHAHTSFGLSLCRIISFCCVVESVRA